MHSVAVEDGTGIATVQVGARNTDVYESLQPHEAAISAGRCPTVAIGGLVLGGGIGFSSRKRGLTCDNLLETETVTADGQILTCNEREQRSILGLPWRQRRQLRRQRLLHLPGDSGR